jgi:hypothetical protein
MRIYNGTNSQVNLPLAGNQRITIAPKAVSGDIMSSTELLSLLVTSYRTDELALVISGPFEINLCATIPATTEYVVQSLDEAIQRFNSKPADNKKEEKPEEGGSKKEEVVSEEAPFPINLDEQKPEPDAVNEPGEVEDKSVEEEDSEESKSSKKRGGKKNKE